MTLKTIQKFEIVWVILGFLFNSISYWLILIGHSGLANTNPIAGNVFMTICGIVVILGLKGFNKVYKYLMPFLTLALAYAGWFLHISAYITDAKVLDYASFESWLAVILINTYGVVIMTLGCWLAFRE